MHGISESCVFLESPSRASACWPKNKAPNNQKLVTEHPSPRLTVLLSDRDNLSPDLAGRRKREHIQLKIKIGGIGHVEINLSQWVCPRVCGSNNC
jgi:hypothetical protein